MTHLKAPLERFKVQREEDFLQDAYEISLKEVIKVTMVTLERLLVHHREGFGLPFLQYILAEKCVASKDHKAAVPR